MKEYFKYKLATMYMASLKFPNHSLRQISKLTNKNIAYDMRSAGTLRVPRPRTNYGLQMIQHTLPTVLNFIKEQGVCIENFNKNRLREILSSSQHTSRCGA